MFTSVTGEVAWAMACLAVSRAVLRLTFAMLTIYAVRKALRPTALTKPADRLRAHRLAVLRTLLGSRGHLTGR